MSLPTTDEARTLLHSYVTDPYQRLHAEMVAAATAAYADIFNEDEHLYWVTGYLHDIDYEQFPSEHPGPSLQWFKDWGYPEVLMSAVEAHADGFNGFTKKPETNLDKALMACDEICGIFYAYQKLNPIPFGQMKISSIKKKLAEGRFAPGINRTHIYGAIETLNITLDEHLTRLITALSKLDPQSH